MSRLSFAICPATFVVSTFRFFSSQLHNRHCCGFFDCTSVRLSVLLIKTNEGYRGDSDVIKKIKIDSPLAIEWERVSIIGGRLNFGRYLLLTQQCSTMGRCLFLYGIRYKIIVRIKSKLSSINKLYCVAIPLIPKEISLEMECTSKEMHSNFVYLLSRVTLIRVTRLVW